MLNPAVGVEPNPLTNRRRDYQRIERALGWLADNFHEQPSLAEAAAAAGLSAYHFQRLFCRWVGISPKQFVQLLSLEQAKRSLDRKSNVLDAAFDAGLSGPGRLHDLFVSLDAITPGEYKSRGAGLEIRYAFHDTPFGECLVMRTERGTCGLSFVDSTLEACLGAALRGWEKAAWVEDPDFTASVVAMAFAVGPNSNLASPFKLVVRGSRFQLHVWRALLSIPGGDLISYQQLANKIGSPTGARAVARAVASNPIAFIIPCHRVIRKTGALGGYRWGVARKLAMINREISREQMWQAQPVAHA